MIPPSIEWPEHRNTRIAGTTQFWYGSDNKEDFDVRLTNADLRHRLSMLGWLETEITYKFNQQGFRSIEFDTELSAGMAVGCSFTQGVGSLQQYIWPEIVSRKINLPIWNLGIGGCAMDTVFRLVDYWVPVLKPKFVLLACPSKHRLEVCDERGNFTCFFPSQTDHADLYKQWILNDANAEINFKKNLLAIQAVCTQQSVPLVYLDIAVEFNSDHGARDLAHPGATAHNKFADKMIQKLQGII